MVLAIRNQRLCLVARVEVSILVELDCMIAEKIRLTWQAKQKIVFMALAS